MSLFDYVPGFCCAPLRPSLCCNPREQQVNVEVPVIQNHVIGEDENRHAESHIIQDHVIGGKNGDAEVPIIQDHVIGDGKNGHAEVPIIQDHVIGEGKNGDAEVPITKNHVIVDGENGHVEGHIIQNHVGGEVGNGHNVATSSIDELLTPKKFVEKAVDLFHEFHKKTKHPYTEKYPIESCKEVDKLCEQFKHPKSESLKKHLRNIEFNIRFYPSKIKELREQFPTADKETFELWADTYGLNSSRDNAKEHLEDFFGDFSPGEAVPAEIIDVMENISKTVLNEELKKFPSADLNGGSHPV